eukprot:SAG11_NODE_26779_length_340_cov_17.307054_1_plen_46_part_00
MSQHNLDLSESWIGVAADGGYIGSNFFLSWIGVAADGGYIGSNLS